MSTHMESVGYTKKICHSGASSWWKHHPNGDNQWVLNTERGWVAYCTPMMPVSPYFPTPDAAWAYAEINGWTPYTHEGDQ